jgi:enoyl-CoA hydratase
MAGRAGMSILPSYYLFTEMGQTMEYKLLNIERRESALLLTINRPGALNALNKDLIDSLCQFFQKGYQAHLPFTAIIITGAEQKAFAAGADISEFTGMKSEVGSEFAKKGQQAMGLIEKFHVPVIAAVNGFALGGGCELAMACHLRVASENARFGQPEVNLGLIPGYGGTQRLVQLIGKGKALELMLTGDMIDAQTALRLGLVNAVTTQEHLLETCMAIVAKISEKAPLAIKQVISCVNAYFDPTIDGYAKEVSRFAALLDSKDFIEGTEAFLSKRKPKFTGS